MSHPLVVNVHREACDVYVGRPSKWGNPYKISNNISREEAIRLYRKHINNSPELLAALPELKGKRLGCFCAPNACHADILAELANDGLAEFI